MDKKVAIVTGGAAGIGKSISERLADENYKVIICDIDAEKGSILEENNKNFDFQKCNVAKEEDIKEVIGYAKDQYGQIDAMINNAGIIKRREGEEIKVSDWDQVFSINTRGAFLFCKYVTDIMKEQESGKIVNISSIAGKLGDITSAPGYGPSKSAVNGLTKTFANELAPYGVTVNAVAPHAIETPMSSEWSEEKRERVVSGIPLNRLGKPEEVAAAVAFLLSDGSDYITGEIIDVNGGFLMD